MTAKSEVRTAFLLTTRVVVAVLAMWSLIGTFLWQQYSSSMENAKRFGLHLSFVMAELAEQSLTVNQLVMESMLDWIAEEEVRTEEQFRRLVSGRSFYERLVGRTVKLPSIDVATFIGSDGTVLNYSREYPPRRINLSDRDYFIEQMSSDAPPVSLGKTVRNRGSGVWTFYMAKEVRGSTGSKLGVVITGAGVSYFASQFRRMLREHQGGTLHQGDAAFLVRDDGVLLAASVEGAPLGARTFPPRHGIGEARGVYPIDALVSPAGGLTSSSPLATLPAYVVTVTDPAPFLSEWKRMLWAMIAMGAGLSVLWIAVGWRDFHRLRARDRLLRQEGERRLLSAIFGSPLALAALVTSGRRILYCNSAFSASLGAVIQSGCLVFGPETDGSGALTALLKGDTPRADFTLRVHCGNCSPAFLRFFGARVELDQGGEQIALLGYDDTQRMTSEAHIIQSAKLITLGEMATSMAHELNQPLNVIKMAAQSALFEYEDVGNPDGGAAARPVASPDSAAFIQARLQRVVEQVDRAAIIIDHMRIFGRVPEGKPPRIDAAETCRSALQLVGHQLRDSQVNVVLRPGDTPQFVKCHPVLLEQVLVNLLLNARDATAGVSNAAREIRIEVGGTDDEVIILVSDNGPGIPSAFRDRVFEPFFTTKSAEKGTGLGLSVSYGIVRDSGGKLELLDSPDGCVFRIALPAAPDPAARDK